MNFPSIIALLATATLSSSTVIKSPDSGAIPPNFELLILHNNDMHARFEQTSQLSGVCTTADREAGKCYGGFPRVATVVKEARRKAASGEGPPVLYLNAGDTYTGTAWFTIYKWKIAAEFINALRPDAVSLGTNDIQASADPLSPFLNEIKTNIVTSNVFPNTVDKKLEKSVIFDINGVKVGVIGYLTPNSNTVQSNNIEYINEIIAVKDEVDNLKTQNVKIVIALGHSDTNIAQEIARDVEGVDLVINGYRNQYLWSGKSTTGELEILRQSASQTQESGKVVPVLESVAYDKYLGRVNIQFDENGNIEDVQINPILLDKSIPQDSESIEIINKYSDEVMALNNEVVGNTAVVLDGDSCATEECNFGNLIADAMVYYHALRFEGERWTDAPIAIIHSGAIDDSIAPANRPAAVTRGDLMSALPTESNVVLMEINGTVFNQMLEQSVAEYSLRNPTGAFLHFSGVRVVYDLSKEPGSRVVSAVVRCHNCYLPTFYIIEDFRTYPILMPAALARGEYGYDMLQNPPLDMYEHDELTTVAEYIRLRSPVYPEVAGRIRLLNSLGNHELDNGVSGLTPFIANLTCPVLAANLILAEEPSLKAEPNLMNSVIFNINGTKVGVIGYLTPDTKVLAIRNDVEYIEETVAIKQEVAKFKKEGVKILIALGHSGFTKDLEIAKEVEDIDLVIGGHTNTFLWNGTTPDVEVAEGPYPTLVKQRSGRLVPAVQAYAYTKYLGKLHLVFNAEGEIVSYDGNPVLLNSSVPQDPEVLTIVNHYRGEVLKISEVVVGNSSVILDGHSCRLRECNLGNFITDAMVHKYASLYQGVGWTDAPIAIIQGGGIRTSVVHVNLPTVVTKGDLLTVMPFDGNTVKVTLNGTLIWNMLEHAVARYNPKRAPGQFLQLSGLRVEYDFRYPPGKRVVKVSVRCGMCPMPTYSLLNKTAIYKILMPAFLSTGGDGYQSLGNHEFDNGVKGLTPFIENLTCPVLTANIDLTTVPELAAETNLKKSMIIDIDGVKIGIVGYLTPDTKVLAVQNNVEYIDEIVAIREEVKKLQEKKIRIIIALGHSGYVKDLQIAKEVEGVDLVIGGHTNTFLWNGTTPDSDEPQGPYPTYVKQASGRSVPVVQAYAYTKYFGKLLMTFDSTGEAIKISGEPILLDNSIPQDPDVIKIIERYRDDVLNVADEVIGNTSVILSGENCKYLECNIGNLITDAMVYRYAALYKGEYWTDAPIAIIQGGGIRASISYMHMPANITKGDLLIVMPFEGNLVTVSMTGSVIFQMLEHSSLGNHEFDETVDGLVPFIKNISSPVVAANLILNDVPELQEVNNLYETVVLEKNGVKIGIIGYLTPETTILAPKNKVQIEEEIQAIQREICKLKKQGVKILIALGHSGFVKDIAIAKNVEDLDLVIGGHSNTFLWNGGLTEKPETREGPYPTVVIDSNGRKVLVVQAYAYTKYMGHLHLTFNSNGEVIEYDGLPILLNNSIPEDPEVLNIVNKYRESVYKISNEVAGTSNVTLDGNCRLRECNLGNIITDILINYTKRYYSEDYADVHIAVCQGGRIRVSIDYPQKPFNMTKGDWINVLPFTDTMTIVSMNGSILRSALEHSVALWRPIDSVGQFLQFSGMKVVYDLLKPAGSRIVEAHAICSNCGNPELAEIEDKHTYKLMMPTFLAEGGDGFGIFVGLPQEPVPYNELTCIYDYLKEFGTISPEVSDRIILLHEKEAIAIFMKSYSRTDILQPSSGHSIHSGLYITYVAILFLCILLSRLP
ncbi:uncharacterized protein LOC133526563 [Cydia pomonella]|uniref:uncharacterized protein LOC133526563 n=1 Tax=Cydia pomonella TaxID=82600 RepID=UPI002ADD6317|nr:uncharacterized protein LOC133526563 [Cydia pomonella]